MANNPTVGANAQTVGVQLERVKDKVYRWFQQDTTLLGRIQVKTDNVEVSSRNCRIPILVEPGGQPQQINPDGGDMGTGSAELYDNGNVTPVYFSHAVEVTALFDWATDSPEKSVVPAFKDLFKNNLNQFRTFIESLLNTDGSATLDTVVVGSSGSAQMTVNNANQFQGQQIIQVWSALGGSNRGSVNIVSVDSVANIIYLAQNAPSGTTAGDLLLIQGASGAANSSLNGVEALNLSSTSGTWFGLNRTTYPGMLTTPTVNVGNLALTPEVIRLGQAYLKRALGVENQEVGEMIWHAGPDMVAAWENVGLVNSSVIQNQVSGDSSFDYLKKNTVKRMADHELLESIHAKPGRIDGICLKHWFRVETKKAELYSVGPQNIFPIYGGSGGITTQKAFYFVCGMQTATDLARAGLYFSNIAVPAGY